MTALRVRTVNGVWPGQATQDTSGFAAAVITALTVERLVTKREEVPNDMLRHQRACELIERVARARPPEHLPDLVIAAGDMLCSEELASEPVDRVNASFHAPEDIPALIAALESSPVAAADVLRQYAEAVGSFRAGIVMFADHTDTAPMTIEHEPLTPPAMPAGDDEVADAFAAAPRTGDVCFAERQLRLAALASLRSQIELALRTGAPLAIGSQARHDVITEALREYVTLPWGRLRLVYVDGSEPEPLPAGLGPAGARQDAEPQLRIGLMSQRHTKMDASVDAYWFRNRLVSTNTRSFAETDAFCARETIKELDALAASGVHRIEIVQTGYEAAVVGFYRGLAQWLHDGGKMTIIPRYLSETDGLAVGTAWSS